MTTTISEKELRNQAEEELFNAIQALEKGDLPFARSSALRAANRIVEAHQTARKTKPDEIVDPKS